MQQNIQQYYEASHPGEVVVVGADLFNCTPSSLGGFRQSTGATYPLLLLSAVNTGGNIQTLYGERDHYVVINKQGIVRYQANDRWPYGNGYHLAEIRACVDSLLTPVASVNPGRLVVREPAGRPRVEGPSSAKSEVEASLPAGAALGVESLSGSTVAVALANPLDRAAEARVTVYDLAGRRVATLLDGRAAPGLTTMRWDGRDAAGHAVAPGVYHVRAELAGAILSRRIALVR